MTKHSPLIRLDAARLAVTAAEIACPHWDMAGDFDCDEIHSCCYDLIEARDELRLSRRLVDKAACGVMS